MQTGKTLWGIGQIRERNREQQFRGERERETQLWLRIQKARVKMAISEIKHPSIFRDM
jgi:hypothetical protein